MFKRSLMAIPFAGILFLLTLGDSPAQPPKAKTKLPETQTSSDGTTVIEMYQDRSGDWRFRIKNGEATLAMASKGYDSKDACRKVIATLQRDVARAKVVEMPKAPAGPSK